jgi:hypothetical protein
MAPNERPLLKETPVTKIDQVFVELVKPELIARKLPDTPANRITIYTEMGELLMEEGVHSFERMLYLTMIGNEILRLRDLVSE